VAVDKGRSVMQALREPSLRRVCYRPLAKVSKTRKPLKANVRRKRSWGSAPPPRPCVRARSPVGGPRVSLVDWHRLGCLLRGTTRPRLCTPSCMHLPGAGVPTQGTSHWWHPLGESNDFYLITYSSHHDNVNHFLAIVLPLCVCRGC
jgi:hypothetical protein